MKPDLGARRALDYYPMQELGKEDTEKRVPGKGCYLCRSPCSWRAWNKGKEGGMRLRGRQNLIDSSKYFNHHFQSMKATLGFLSEEGWVALHIQICILKR